MSELRWITLAQIIRIHDEQLQIFGGSGGLRDGGMLQSALDRPRNKYANGETSIAKLAAAYAFGLSRNHPFVDGNKRTAFAAMIVFLIKNGAVFDAPQAEAADRMIALAAGDLSETELGAWISRYVRFEGR